MPGQRLSCKSRVTAPAPLRPSVRPVTLAAALPRTVCTCRRTLPPEPDMTELSRLLEPLAIGDLRLANRVFMAPLTRCRASAGRVPNTLMRDYYVQRASAGLILSEATSVTPMGVGYPDTPGIWSPEQVQGWKMITDAMHAAGGK